jgi:peptidoglycan/xylan/chitin deacetylase (PgdA/CDA1 family)
MRDAASRHQHRVIVAVDPAVRGMSRVADALEATPVLPSRMALRQAIDVAREPGPGEREPHLVAVLVPSSRASLALYARLAGADRVAVYHGPGVHLSSLQRVRLRAALAGVDLCLVPDAPTERAAAALGADPERLARVSRSAAARMFREPPRRGWRGATLEMAASLALDGAEAAGLVRALEVLSPSRGVNVVNYHRVLPVDELVRYCRPQMALAAPIFEAQLSEMAARRGFAPLDRIHEPGARDRVSVTFDDGYEDNFRVAWPALSEVSAPACIFLVTGLVGRPDALWWDRVGAALFAYWRSGAEAEVPPTLPERAQGLRTTTSQEAARALISDVLSDLNRASEAERDAAVAAAEALVPPADAAGRTMLTWDEVQALSRAGVTFGAHTRNHVPLDELPRDEAALELLGSQADLDAHLGPHPYRTCALPRGRRGELEMTELADAFDSVMTTEAGVHDPEEQALFVKRRDGRMLTLAGRHHPAKLRLELTGWVDRLRRAYYARTGQAPD